MAYTTIDDPTKYFVTVLYTGNDTARTITTGLETTDFIWNKRRDSAGSHLLYDKVRGINKDLNSESTEAEETQVGTVTAFGTDSFNLGTHGGTNANGESKVNWCWSAGGTTGSSNTDGSITSTVSANTTAGFSIVSYTGTGSNATVGHNLGSTPKVVIIKNRSNSADWIFFTTAIDGSMDALQLNLTNAKADSSTTAPTSSVFSIIGASSAQGSSGDNYVAYCFAEKKGYSKFGSYTGNANTDGTFVYTGFKPAFIIAKDTGAVNAWYMFDNKRSSYNGEGARLMADASDAEVTNNNFDILSNGFKNRLSGTGTNRSGATFIYMAFAENPFVTSTGIPTTAR